MQWMVSKVAVVTVAGWMVCLTTLAAQDEQPKRLRFDLTPFIGYRSGMSIPVTPQNSGSNLRVVIDSSPSYGFSFGLRPREEDLIEVRWARQDSYVHSEEITSSSSLERVLLDQFHGDFSHEPYIEEWPWWAKPYVLASVGGTHLGVSNRINFTRFSFGLGAGIRLYATRHFGFKLQAEWLPVVLSPQVAFICGGGCIIHVGGTAVSQGEVIAGPLFRF